MSLFKFLFILMIGAGTLTQTSVAQSKSGGVSCPPKKVCIDGFVVPDIEPLPPHPETPLTDKQKLGMLVFCHPKLSKSNPPDNPVGGGYGCVSCHNPAEGFAQHRPQSQGVFDPMPGLRNAPSIYNVSARDFKEALFWDGHASSLKEQVLFPITGIDMGVSTEMFIRKLKKSRYPDYKTNFAKAFGKDLDSLSTDDAFSYVAEAIADFERTIVSTGSPFDKYMRGVKSGKNKSIPGFGSDEKAGMMLFRGEARCILCHNGPNFTDNRSDNVDRFHNVGHPRDRTTGSWILPKLDSAGRELSGDAGRYRVTKLDEDLGAFLTPTLRNVAKTWPYMHNGSLPVPTRDRNEPDGLAETVEFFITGGGSHANLDRRLRPMEFKGDTNEKRDNAKKDVIGKLVAFLNSLTDNNKIADSLKDDCPLKNPS